MSGGRLHLVRHGETEWSRSGRHTGRTDVPLSPEGEVRARGLAARLSGLDPLLVLASPLERGRSFVLDPAGVGVLGHERETPVIAAWNG